ncbi:MAG: hypothetical protein U0175_33285, partial [Caldilineaceae bacterium]
MSKSSRYPSYVDCVAQVLSQSREPMSLDTLITHIAGQRPLTRNARSAVMRALDQLYQAVPIAPDHYCWLSAILDGSVFRHPLTNEEARQGFLLLDELEHAVLFPDFFQNHTVDGRTLSIELFGAETVQAWTEVERQIWSLRLGKEFVEWLENQGAMGRDDLVLTVMDASAGRYGLRLQPREARDAETIQQRNIELAKLATELVLNAADNGFELAIWGLAARLIARKYYNHPVPPDELHYVLQKFSSLTENEQGVLYQSTSLPKSGEGLLAWEYNGKRVAQEREHSIFDFSDEVERESDDDLWLSMGHDASLHLGEGE